MNRNVSIVVIILILVAIAGYLVWIRSKVPVTVIPQTEQVQEATVAPVASPTVTASASATPKAKEATGSTKLKTATSGAIKK